jgi:hypothetical protein
MATIEGFVIREKPVRLPAWTLGSVRIMTGRTGRPEGPAA